MCKKHAVGEKKNGIVSSVRNQSLLNPYRTACGLLHTLPDFDEDLVGSIDLYKP